MVDVVRPVIRGAGDTPITGTAEPIQSAGTNALHFIWAGLLDPAAASALRAFLDLAKAAYRRGITADGWTADPRRAQTEVAMTTATYRVEGTRAEATAFEGVVTLLGVAEAERTHVRRESAMWFVLALSAPRAEAPPRVLRTRSGPPQRPSIANLDPMAPATRGIAVPPRPLRVERVTAPASGFLRTLMAKRISP